MWANMVLAYEKLPEHIKTQIAGLRARHSIEASFGAAMPIEKRLALHAQFPDAEHPVVRTHPETGEKVLFVNAFTTHFTNFHTADNVRVGQDYAPGAIQLLQYLISQAADPRVPGALALAAEQHGDVGQPQHPALRGDGLPALPPQDGTRRHRRRSHLLITFLTPLHQGPTMNFLDGSLFPENQDKLVITAAPYGPEWIPSDFPEDIPVTMEEQVQKAVDCYNAGATVLHLHVRELDGKGSKQLSKFNELIAGVRKAVPDMIIQVGGSISFAPPTEGAAAKWLSDDTRHMLAELDPKPDQVTVTVNTTQMNVAEQMEAADLAGTSLAEPANFHAYSEHDRAVEPGVLRGACAPPVRRRHPERLPVLQHQQLRDGRAPDPPRRLQGSAGVQLGGDRRRHGPADGLQPGQLPARHPRRRRADGGKQHAQRAADQHDGHGDGPARALRHRGQPLEPVAHRRR